MVVGGFRWFHVLVTTLTLCARWLFITSYPTRSRGIILLNSYLLIFYKAYLESELHLDDAVPGTSNMGVQCPPLELSCVRFGSSPCNNIKQHTHYI